MQVLGKEWAQTALDIQEKVHKVAVTILKALFIALGRDETIIDDVSTPLTHIIPTRCAMLWNVLCALAAIRW